MFKKLCIGLIIALSLMIGGLRYVGVSVLALDEAFVIASGLGAKVGCSEKFVSGYSKEQIINDLAAYSPLLNWVELEFDGYQVSADFLGVSQASATFRQGLGCTLDTLHSEFDLSTLSVPSFQQIQQPWPLGNHVSTIRHHVQVELEKILQNDIAQGLDTRALLVVREGQVVAEAYQAGFNANTSMFGWSMGKSVTSIMLGHWLQNREAKVHQELSFAEWQGDTRKDITLVHLLQMTSGLAFDEKYIPGADATQMLFVDKSSSALALSKPLLQPVGEQFNYSSGTTNILMQYLLQELNNEPQKLLDLFYNQIAQPMGLVDTVFEVDAQGMFVGSSFILATAREWAKFGWLMVNNGKINSHQLLQPSWIKAATQPNTSLNEKGYGYQFWLNRGDAKLRWPSLPMDTYAMLGSKKQRVMMFPSTNTVIVRLGWSGHYPDDQNFSQILAALDNS